MCHATLQDPKLFSFLLLFDQDLAAQARAAGCACGGVLHSARYPRKPRGAPRELLDQYRSRLSFCCAACRRRTTPESVRYLGRRVYVAAVVLLVSAMRAGITGKRVAQLSGLFAVPLRTMLSGDGKSIEVHDRRVNSSRKTAATDTDGVSIIQSGGSNRHAECAVYSGIDTPDVLGVARERGVDGY